MLSLSTAEALRLEALASYNILDTLPEADYDAITKLAAHICQVPISLISLVDKERLWAKSNHGVTLRELPREIAFCNYTIQTPGQMMEVTNLQKDERFAANPLVRDSGLVFYAGVPLVNKEQQALGSLCVIDYQSRKLTNEQTRALEALARQVVSLLQLRRNKAQLEQSGQKLQALNADLRLNNSMLKVIAETSLMELVLWQAVRQKEVITDFRYVFANPVHLALKGLTKEQLVGQLLVDTLPGRIRHPLFDRLVQVVTSQKPQHYQQCREGDPRGGWDNVLLTPYEDGVLYTVQDLTAQKEKEQILQEALLREQELNKLKTHFVSTASHEFRTPLMTIQSSVDLIRYFLDEPPLQAKPLVGEHLDVIQQQVGSFGELLSDILTIGQIEAGRVTFRPQEVEVLTLVQGVIGTHFNNRIDQRRVHLQVQGQPWSADLDPKLMSHVLINLLSNAFKFSHQDVRLQIAFSPHQLQLQVIDEGIGIPLADQTSLFEAFFRATNTNGIQGTGLGLVIARQFVERHGGQLEVVSQPHQGSTFTITLPRVMKDATIQQKEPLSMAQ